MPFNKIYFLDTESHPATWIPYVNQMVLPETPFVEKRDRMRYKFVGWDKEGIICVSPLGISNATIGHAEIIVMAEKVGIIQATAIDDVWGKIGDSGNITSWKSVRGKTPESKRIVTANSLGLGVKIMKK